MNRGIYPPLAGAITLERRLEVLSHNIGNVQTTGFKKDKPVFSKPFSDKPLDLPLQE